MKKKSSSQSAFFNVRVLIGLFIVSVGVFLALAGFGGFTAIAGNIVDALDKHKIITSSTDPLVPVGFDCSKIQELGIDRQENMAAGAKMIACGRAAGGSGSTTATSTLGPIGKLVQKALTPLAPETPQVFGAGDVDLITGSETSPNVTQSETFTTANPDDPNQVLVAYNDSRGRNATPINISGASFSTDGGTTFVRLTAGTQSPFPGTEGDPVVLYNKPTGTWYTVWLDTGCGSQGLGGYKTTTPLNAASWTHFCVHNNSQDDRESGWADNNPASPFYGRMYVSWNNFSLADDNIQFSRSTDNGTTWSAPITVNTAPGFIRNVQITGDSVTGDLYIAGMNENGGNANFNRNNLMFRSTDGGSTWTNTYTGPTFQGPGVTNSGYFACMFSPAYWRHEGWGQPAAYNHVVSLVYASRVGAPPADAGDVYYIRSTDSGATFSAPFKLNSDSTTRPQWQPNLSASATGTLFATWYDGRNNASCAVGNPAQPCYRMFSRKSNDNGVTWLPDEALSDVESPLPAQPDPGIQATYVGDYDYGSALATKHLTSWVDGRVAISGQSQQDAFTDRELVGFAVTTANPGCGSIVFTQPTDFVVNLTDPVDPASVQASDFTVNGIPANSFVLSNGNATITFHFNSSPVTAQGVQTMHIAAGAINRASDNQGNLDFTCTFRYDALLLQVTTTNPPVGGTFNPPAPNTYTYDVNFNEAVDPSSVQPTDLMVSGTSGPAVTGVSVINGNMTARFTLSATFGGSLTANIAAGAILDPFGNPNAAFTGNYNVSGCPPAQYVIAPGTDAIVPGIVDTGNHVDDGDTTVALPFPFKLYGQSFSSVKVNSNGRLDFVVTNEPLGYVTACLPPPPNQGPYDYTIFGLWQDLRTDAALSGCSGFPGGQCGIFTSVTGVPPNRIFNVEWRTVLFSNNASRNNFEVRLYENSIGTNLRFDVIYGTINTTGATRPYVAGVQGATGFVTQDFCNTPPPQNVSRAYTIPPCTLTVSSAVSRKTHGAAGPFDIDLPLTGTTGVEDRSGGTFNDFTVVVTFSTNVTVGGTPQAQVTSGIGCVGSGGTCDANGIVAVSGNIVTIPLTNVADQQTINISLNGVNSASIDVPALDVVIPMSRLLGDTNGNRAVNASDVSQTKGRIGQPVTNANFRSDINFNGAINSADASLVKANSGHAVP